MNDADNENFIGVLRHRLVSPDSLKARDHTAASLIRHGCHLGIPVSKCCRIFMLCDDLAAHDDWVPIRYSIARGLNEWAWQLRLYVLPTDYWLTISQQSLA